MRPLHFTTLEYDPALEEHWRSGRYGWFQGSAASPFLKRVLVKKARTWRAAALRKGSKPTRRFFGEAFVSSRLEHEKGWFGSFKFLTARNWAVTPHGVELRAALRQHVGDALIAELRSNAARIVKKTGFKPVVPDLWFVKGTALHFVEAKLPGDDLSDEQIAGFAVFAACSGLRAELEVQCLHPANSEANRRWWPDAMVKFESFCAALSPWSLQEATVDPSEEQIVLHYKRGARDDPERWEGAVRVAKPQEHTFRIQWFPKLSAAGRAATLRELNFYLLTKGEPNPWGYAQYHCSTAANVYSEVGWSYFPTGYRMEHVGVGTPT
jgi:hypothetical protein